MRPDIAHTEQVEELVVAFYAKVREDTLLAPFFAEVDWAHHTPRIVAFWSSMLLGTASYAGDPMAPHRTLHQRMPMGPQHFQRWLQLFHATVQERFEGPKADEALNRATSIAAVMAHHLGRH